MVDLYSGSPRDMERQKTTNCIIIFVAVDEEGKTTPVPRWEAETEEELKLEQYAKILMEKRKKIHEEHTKIFGKE
jgi:acyl-CoA hydrolase